MPLTVTPTDEQNPTPQQLDERPAPVAGDERPRDQYAAEPGTATAEAPSPFYSPNIPGETDPETAWKQYVPQALQGLYPHMKAGEDYVWASKDFGQEPEMLHWNEKYQAVDMGEVEKIAKQMSKNDPYISYEAKPPLHAGRSDGTEFGEEHTTAGNY